MNLIERDDPRYFTQTSDEPYDRHLYKVVYHSGDFGCEYKIVDSWEEVQELWWNSIPQFISHVEILDKKQKSKGFK
tara:strand:+ start:1176 stop:1403 length:228 start_codon:yes stop_codon:yes gene_type:complete